MSSVVLSAEIPGLPMTARGKVRDIYDLGPTLIIVTTDRISAYDVVMPNGIPDKGRVLTGLSRYWFLQLRPFVANHYVTYDIDFIEARLLEHGVELDFHKRQQLAGRAMLVLKAEVFPVECVVRGYLAGSLWKEYVDGGGPSGPVTLHGIGLPGGLRESDRLPEPIFTPATKAEIGEHDENIDFDRAAEIVGDRALMDELWRLSLEVYGLAAEHAERHGIVLADTKFEFGRDSEGRIVLADEVLTPDSSRFWPRDAYAPGGSQPSFDKQYVRDWLDESGWDHSRPGPELPDEVVANTRAKYVEAYERITGESFDSWLKR